MLSNKAVANIIMVVIEDVVRKLQVYLYFQISIIFTEHIDMQTANLGSTI